jgi:hypothetical protein
MSVSRNVEAMRILIKFSVRMPFRLTGALIGDQGDWG